MANEVIARSGGFSDLFIIPAAEDSGPAIGAAFHGLWQLSGQRCAQGLHGMNLAPHTPARESKKTLLPRLACAHTIPAIFIQETVATLRAGEVIGWFQGGSELGPRALGRRRHCLLIPRGKTPRRS